MQFISGVPQGVYVGQTQIQHPAALPTAQASLAGFNLALHVQDQPQRVHQHRMQLLQQFAQHGVSKLTWMNQTHSTTSYCINDACFFDALDGDGLVTQKRGHALMMMTADCLPVVLGNASGTEVANLHAGWRGLAAGIVENTLAQMQTPATWAWLGAAISQPCFEVGAEVKSVFCDKYPQLASAFEPAQSAAKYYADLYAIARYILQENNIAVIMGGNQCSYRQAQDYYSYRREAKTGRMATFVFMA